MQGSRVIEVGYKATVTTGINKSMKADDLKRILKICV